jgi:hypothetical protein
MISVNISTIKQYFWYYDNFNKNIILDHDGKQILPILKVKHRCYIFSDKNKLTFGELQKNFVTYDKIYTYMVIEADENIQSAIETMFEMFVCVFIDVDENSIWEIEKNELLEGNKFYRQMIKNNENITFVFPKKKQISATKINLLASNSNSVLVELPIQHVPEIFNISDGSGISNIQDIQDIQDISDSSDISNIQDMSNIQDVQKTCEESDILKSASNSFHILDKYIEQQPRSRQSIELNSVEFESGRPNPFFDDFVIIDDPNSADL